MKKSILALTAISFLAGNLAFANTDTNNNRPKHNPEFHKAIGECMAEAGIKKPEFNKDDKSTDAKKSERSTKAERAQKAQNGERSEPPKDAQGNLIKPPFSHGKHPKFEMTDEQRTKVDACLTKKGIEKPQPRS